MIFLPFFISFTIGFLIVSLFLKKETQPNLYLKIILGAGLGLGLSSYMTFGSFLFLNRLEPQIIINIHLLLLCALLFNRAFLWGNNSVKFTPPKWSWQKSALLILGIIILACVFKQALFYPHGGWDAWQVWNFKAKFLLLAEDNWHNLFSPELWRSSPHYPLLLPLINVWGWLFTEKPVSILPLITSFLFTGLTAGLLCSALWERTKNLFSILPGLLLLTLPFFNLLATTQYCDIVLSFYLLAGIMTLLEAQKHKKSYLALLSGIFNGFLGFTKPEGLIAALILGALVVSLTTWSIFKKQNVFSSANTKLFFIGFILASLPTLAFHVLYSPGNQTFINGLTSTLKPATWERLQVIFMYLGTEFKSGKWNGLWFLILLGGLLGGKKLWTENFLVAIFLFIYFGVILAYYEINTYFEIKWWLSVSLNRILFSLLPLTLFWVFSSILSEKKKN
ncbi:MAG: hypothetical protein H6754_07790 [Candidatus Omnitrophica bacterium]|nr:hypothetical protein [Candidatus Omnitrophota bacterium]